MSRNFERDLLAGKRALITGGGTGLGKAIGHRYLELGADLVICGRRLEVLEATAQEFSRAFGRAVQTEQCDIRSPDAVDSMFDRIGATGSLDILVNNAAGNFLAQSEKLSPRWPSAIAAST